MSQDHSLSGAPAVARYPRARGVLHKDQVLRRQVHLGRRNHSYRLRSSPGREATIRLSGQFDLGLSLLRLERLPFQARGKSGGVGTNRSYEMLLKIVSRYILILSL